MVFGISTLYAFLFRHSYSSPECFVARFHFVFAFSPMIVGAQDLYVLGLPLWAKVPVLVLGFHSLAFLLMFLLVFLLCPALLLSVRLFLVLVVFVFTLGDFML